MNEEMQQETKKSKSTILAVTVLSVHVAAAGFFALQGCQTRKPVVAADEPAPAPIMPPSRIDTPPVAPPRPSARPAVPVGPVSKSPESAGAVSYTVQKGDSLSKIAAKAGVSSRELAELNNITNPNSIRIGQKLLLPAYAKPIPQSAAPATAKAPAAPKKPKSAEPAVASGDSHTVQSGDTLGKLASRYGTTVAAFREVNKLKNDMIRVGQKLSIPKGKSSTDSAAPSTDAAPAPAPAADAPAAEAAPSTETNLSAPASPAPAPPVADPVIIPVTDTPEPAAASASPATGEAPFPYTVKEGDTLDSIAIKFSVNKTVIANLNSLASEAIAPGQKLLIPWQ